ncbi:MAG: AMP-binding protein, partial [Janthinobacterium lividum]
MPDRSTDIATIDRHAALHEDFRWLVPADFNIGQACCTRWAGDAQRIAIYQEDEQGRSGVLTYAALQEQACRLANVLRGLGVMQGDRIALLLPQRPETAVAHIACHLLGAIAMPMSILFGPDAIEFRLRDSRAKVAIVDHAGVDNLASVRANCPALEQVIVAHEHAVIDNSGDLDWHRALASAPVHIEAAATLASD